MLTRFGGALCFFPPLRDYGYFPGSSLSAFNYPVRTGCGPHVLPDLGFRHLLLYGGQEFHLRAIFSAAFSAYLSTLPYCSLRCLDFSVNRQARTLLAQYSRSDGQFAPASRSSSSGLSRSAIRQQLPAMVARLRMVFLHGVSADALAHRQTARIREVSGLCAVRRRFFQPSSKTQSDINVSVLLRDLVGWRGNRARVQSDGPCHTQETNSIVSRNRAAGNAVRDQCSFHAGAARLSFLSDIASPSVRRGAHPAGRRLRLVRYGPKRILAAGLGG